MKKLLPSIIALVFVINAMQAQLAVSFYSVINVSCFGGNNGSAGVSATNGSGPYTYTWMPSGSNSNFLTNVSAGTYTVIVADAVSVITGTVNITQPTPLVASVTSTNSTCGFNNAAACITSSGGTYPHTYMWSNTVTSACNYSIAAGNYSFVVNDANGCPSSNTITINDIAGPMVAITSHTNVSCFGMCDGRAIATANGGTLPYTYNWTAGTVNSPISNSLCAGIYNVSVIDANGCVAVASSLISQPQMLSIVNVSKTNASCGNCDGSANVSVTGGNLPYNYTWQPSLPNSAVVNNLCTGTYSLFINDARGCNTATLATISSSGNTIPNITVTSTKINESCNGSHDGSLSVNITGSNSGPFTYQWSNGATTQSIYNLTTGSYFVTVSDGTNCATYSQTVGLTGGANCGSISGNVFLDANNNCTLNGGEVGYQGALITAQQSGGGYYYGYSDAQGNYSIVNLNANTFYTVTINPNNFNVLTSCGNTTMAVLSPTNSNVVANFPVSANVSLPDVQVSAGSSGIVPGFNNCVSYYVSNVNIIGATGIVKATLPSVMMANFTSASPNYTISADTIMWSFSLSAGYYNTVGFNVCFTTPVNTPLGSTFTTCVMAQTTPTDINPANNNYCYSRMVTGSFDPNDKTVSPVGTGTNGGIVASETDLTYLICFQNTGNGPAVNITVMDTLSANVDVTTFQMLNASHNYHVDILAGNVLRWKFNNILLADSNSNEPASHGYIQYKIKRSNNNTIGTQIKNKAEIYFDFNAPVVTNTALNTIVDVTSVKTINSQPSFIQIYPNPTKGILMVDISTALRVTTPLNDNVVEVLNVLGEVVFQSVLNSRQSSINLQQLNDGVYFIKVTANKQSSVKRVVLSK